MVRPARFGWNPDTAASNAFQHRSDADGGVPARARAEVDTLAAALTAAGVQVIALDESGPDACPDAVFPNNWVTMHHDGTVVLYPMLAPSRRLERRLELLTAVEALGARAVTRLVDLSHHERHGRFLEGTGSVVFDHATGVAYACRSPRTDPAVLDELCDEVGCTPCVFDATDATGRPVYHTNVVLSVGARVAIACAEAIAPADRDAVLERIATGRELVRVDRAQMSEFACNALEFRTAAGRSVLALSSRAWSALGADTRARIAARVDEVVAVPVPTIEAIGGGSVRCMLAEIFLPPVATATERVS